MNIQQIKAQMSAAREAMRVHGQTALKAAFVEFFDTCPEIQAVVWTQYTPYFNDGEPCEFSVGEPEFKAGLPVNTDADDDDDDDCDEPFGYNYGDSCYVSDLECKRSGRSWRTPPTPPQELTKREAEIVKVAREFAEIFREDELFETVFGDHAVICATRAGFEIDPYDHD